MTWTIVQIVVAVLTATCTIFFAFAIIGLILGALIDTIKHIGGLVWKKQ